MLYVPFADIFIILLLGTSSPHRQRFNLFIQAFSSEVNKMSGFTSEYTYDSQNQLTSERIGNGYATLQGSYVYDTYGNIREKTVKGLNGKTVKDSYTYGDSVWLDLLTAVNGKAITYDAIGNPTKYHNGTVFTWEKGRRLSASFNSVANRQVEYSYNAEGIRTGKTVTQKGTAIESQYYLSSGKIVAEKRGNDVLEFIYDEKGAPLNLIYSGVKYSYATNLMGDVVRLYAENGSIAAEYVYDAWGKVISSSGTMAGTNPLRYRGYYFDTETGLYYLNSRYYDPETGRFINADGSTDTGNGFLGLNMFAYCLNNPVQLKDSDGKRPAAISDHPKDKEAAYVEWMVTKPSNGKVTYAPSGGTAPNRGMSSVSFIGREISSVSYTNIKYYTPEQTHEYVNAILKARTQLDVHGGVMAGLGLAGMTKVGAKLFGGPIIGEGFAG